MRIVSHNQKTQGFEMKTKTILFLLFILSPVVFSGGWTNEATINELEIIRGQGFQMTGTFGNPSQCQHGNSVFVSINHPQYNHILAFAMSAYLSQKKVKIYSHKCIAYGWHGGDYNELTGAGSIYLK